MGEHNKAGEKERNLQLLPGAAGRGYHLVCASGFLEGAEGILPGGSLGYRGNSIDLVCGWRGILNIAEGSPGLGGLVSCGPAELWRLLGCCSSCRRSWDKAAKKGTWEEGWSVTITGATTDITCWDWTKPNWSPGLAHVPLSAKAEGHSPVESSRWQWNSVFWLRFACTK